MKRNSAWALLPLCAVLTVAAARASDDGKIPVTTTSEEARKEFLAGRELADNLRLTDAIAHFDRALALDPGFASAELARANVAPTAKDFRAHLDRAVALSARASEGERLAILAAEAASVGDAARAKEYLERNVSLFPEDERARVALGGYYAGQQENDRAIEALEAAIRIAPRFPPAYNNLGYAYKAVGNYPAAEKAFKQYTQLIPGDPNPYDSYAELLMKMGRFDESIAQYQKALALDPHFISARVGSAMDALYLGKPDVATARVTELFNSARHDGERRQALFVQAVIYADQGRMDDAIAEAEKEFAIAERLNDAASMTADLTFKANMLVATGRLDEALATYRRAMEITQASALPEGTKELARLFHHANVAAVALARKDLATARTEAEAFAKESSGGRNRFQRDLVHELAGRIALADGQYDKAIGELQQANQQDPYNLYRLALACQGKGDEARAREYADQAAHWNGLPALNYALIRSRATTLAAR